LLVAIENVIEGHQLYLAVLSETGLLVRKEGIIEGHGLSPMLRLPPIPSEAGLLVAILVAIENIAGLIIIFLLQQHPVIFHYCTIQARKHISVYRATGNTVGDLDLPLCVLGATLSYVLGLRFIRSPPLPLGGACSHRQTVCQAYCSIPVLTDHPAMLCPSIVLI